MDDDIKDLYKEHRMLARGLHLYESNEGVFWESFTEEYSRPLCSAVSGISYFENNKCLKCLKVEKDRSAHEDTKIPKPTVG